MLGEALVSSIAKFKPLTSWSYDTRPKGWLGVGVGVDVEFDAVCKKWLFGEEQHALLLSMNLFINLTFQRRFHHLRCV
jgi:hypothetical protein